MDKKEKHEPHSEHKTPPQFVDRTTGGADDASHSSMESSTAGRTAQSTDHMNQY